MNYRLKIQFSNEHNIKRKRTKLLNKSCINRAIRLNQVLIGRSWVELDMEDYWGCQTG